MRKISPVYSQHNMNSTPKDDKGYVDLVNSMFDIIDVSHRVKKFSDINCESFLLLYEGIIGETVPNKISNPECFSDHLYNMQMLINNLSGDILHISLSHIRGEDILSGDRGSIRNLLEIFNELLNCLLTKISEHYLNNSNTADSQDTQLQVVATPVGISINNHSLHNSSKHLSRKEILSREYFQSSISRNCSDESQSFIDTPNLPIRKMEKQIVSEIARVQDGAVQVGQLVESMMKSRREAEANRRARKQFLCSLIQEYVQNSPSIARYMEKPKSHTLTSNKPTIDSRSSQPLAVADLCDYVPVREKSSRSSSRSVVHKTKKIGVTKPPICDETVDKTNATISPEQMNQLFRDMSLKQSTSVGPSREKMTSSSGDSHSSTLSHNSRDSRIRHKQILMRKKQEEADYKTRVLRVRRQVMPGINQQSMVYHRLLKEATSQQREFADDSLKENCGILGSDFDAEYRNLTDYLRTQHKELQSKERLHQIEFSQLKRELRQQKVKEIRTLQQDILSANDDTYFREKDAQQMTKKMFPSKLKALNSPSNMAPVHSGVKFQR